MSAIEQPAAHVREDDPDLGPGEDVGRLRHEVDAAKDHELRLVLLGRVLGELEAVPREVGVLDDLVALVVVAENHESLPQEGAGAANAPVELGLGQLEIGAGDVLLPGDEGLLLGERHRR
jgi:hypothetical protein